MSDEVKTAKSDNPEEKHHHHGGKSSEGLLDKELILNALDIQPGQKIIDAGCGNGYMSKAFADKATYSGKVYALDHDKHYLGILKRETEGTNVEAIECDITRSIPIDQASADLIYISTVIHGFSKEQLQAFLAEVKRLLKPNGVLAIVEIEKKETPFGPPLNLRFSPEELREVVPMPPLGTIEVGKHFYMQMFKNTEKPED